MEIFIANTYEAMSKQAADAVIELMNPKENPLLCPASGDSPAGLYKELVDRFNKDQHGISGWYFVGLDEWAGMNESDEGSCRFHLDNQLFGPLQVKKVLAISAPLLCREMRRLRRQVGLLTEDRPLTRFPHVQPRAKPSVSAILGSRNQ